MNAEEWLHVDRVFHEALDREPGERARYIEKECSDNPSLRQEVEGLLVSHGLAGNFLEFGAANTVSIATASLASGTRLGPYEILGPVGAGGMGQVYKAHDQRLTRDVAVKVLKHLDSDRAAWERFQREARAASALSHPNICTVHDVGEAEGQPYLVMELLEGVTLTAYIGEKPLETDTTLSIAVQIADALESAHAKGIIHRDIKSANIMINSRGQVKVLDFGLARRLEVTRGEEALTRDGAVSAGGVRGTPAYMPPEVLRGEVADARGDLWALGVLLYQMLTGRLPFTGETVYDISAAILRDAAPPLPASVPADLRAIVERCLAKQPEKRYQSAGEVRPALEALRAPAIPARGISRRTWLRTVGVSAVLLTGAGALVHRLLRTDFPWKARLAALGARNSGLRSRRMESSLRISVIWTGRWTRG
jgi:serine/threonine protein kinase